VRSGNVFQALYSANGSSWSQLGSSYTIAMAGTAYVGLAVTSHNTAALNTSTFDNVSISRYANLAAGKVVTASSVAAGSSAGNAVDGSTATAWQSSGGGTQSVTVDLGAIKLLSHVQLNWNASYATSYNVQISSNNSTWSTVYSTTNGAGGVVDVAGLLTSGRYVRVNLLVAKTGTYGLNELVVNGL